MKSVTLTTPETLTFLVICKSTAGTTVILGVVSLLFDLLVSFSVLVTITALETFPGEIALATITSCLQSSLARLPICQTPSPTS